MLKRAWIVSIALLLAATGASGARLSESYGKLPLHFEENRGQTHEAVRFLARGPGYGLYLTAGEAVLALGAKNEGAVLRMALVGAKPDAQVRGLEELPGKANYFIGKDPAKWRTNVPTYAKVHYREVYPGIDLVYYGNQRQLEYDFVVAPGADPKKIVLGFKGADKLEIDAQGDLVLHAAGGAIHQKKPVIYQEVDGVRHEVAGSYVRKGANRVGFKVATYGTSLPLVIDPVLAYSTYLGGSGSEGGSGIAVDAGGNAYVTGPTASLDFPTTSGAFQPVFGGSDRYGRYGGDAFVTKLDSAGSTLVYSTYLGGSDSEGGYKIAVDADGYAYVTGTTQSSDFPTTPGAYQPVFSGGFDGLCICTASDVFVTKLDPTGSSLVYSTYLGGAASDRSSGIALDAGRNAYVTGHTFGSFPTTPGAFQTTVAGGSGYYELQDAFVTKLNSTGSALVYSTYLGGSQGDITYGISVDAEGSAYLTGFTHSSDFPTISGAFRTNYENSNPVNGDAFVTKLNPGGSALVYSTYLGGASSEWGFGIALDVDRNAYVTGRTHGNFPTTPGAFQTTFAGGTVAYVTKLNSTGSALVYSTYLGGSNGDDARGIAVDASGNAYVTGKTYSSDFPTTPGAFQPVFRGEISRNSGDAFVTTLNATGSALIYSTYLGGSSDEAGDGIAVDARGNAYATGGTKSLDFPTTPGAFQTGIGGGSSDAYVAKFAYATPFTGTPILVPATFEAENFDLGGEAVAYHDNTPGNAGGQYRPAEDVDIIVSTDSAGGGYVVNYFETGEWLAYTIDVASSGNYDIELRVATRFDFSNSAFHIEIDSVNATGSVVLPTTNNDPTNGWHNFEWLGKRTVALSAGQHVLKVVADQQYFNLNSIKVTAAATSNSSTAFAGTPIAVPGTFEVEDFDLGGEGVAYHDNVPGNAGGQYRTSEDVDIIVSSDAAGGGYVVNNFESGEWLVYTIDVASSQNYGIELRVSSMFSDSAFHVEIDGQDVTGSILVPNTGSWSTFQWIGKSGVALPSGQHVLKIVTERQYFNVNSVRVLSSGAASPSGDDFDVTR